jgi:hypothetical protein
MLTALWPTKFGSAKVLSDAAANFTEVEIVIAASSGAKREVRATLTIC